MFVCVCHAITEKDIAQAIEDGAATMKQLRRQLNVGSQCGTCVQVTRNILNATNFDYDLAVAAA